MCVFSYHLWYSSSRDPVRRLATARPTLLSAWPERYRCPVRRVTGRRSEDQARLREQLPEVVVDVGGAPQAEEVREPAP